MKALYACIMALTIGIGVSYAPARASDDNFDELQEHVERLQQETDWNEVSMNQMAAAGRPLKKQQVKPLMHRVKSIYDCDIWEIDAKICEVIP